MDKEARFASRKSSRSQGGRTKSLRTSTVERSFLLSILRVNARMAGWQQQLLNPHKLFWPALGLPDILSALLSLKSG
jgi:hypothetical protein